MPSKPNGPRPDFYTAGEAVAKLNINPILFRWIVNTEGVMLSRFGNRRVFTDETLAQIRAVLDLKDPAGKFRVRAERKNGPRRKKAVAAQ